MATYAIGDIQGCYAPLRRLLARIRFDPRSDRLWLAGDLVNRGPASLEVLRWAHSLGDRLVVVLGNHDLHLLAVARGVRSPGRRDTLDEVLRAPDRDVLLSWLRERPLLHRDRDLTIVHAGLLPAWTIDEALERADRAAALLVGAELERLLDRDAQEDPAMAEPRRTIDVLTRLRVCDPEGAVLLDFSGAPSDAPLPYRPWFELPHCRGDAATVLFGHWAALGHRFVSGAIALDSGCVWGGALTAVRLEDRAVFQEPAAG